MEVRHMTKRIEDFGVDKKMLERLTWKSTFADYISKLVGYPMTKEHVHSDENGWDYFVTSKSLLPNCPLLLVHHTGSLIAIIPYKDYIELEKGEVYPLAYIASAHWNYGKYSGGEDVKTGIFWQPLEKKEGICDSEKISKFLNQISIIQIHPEDYRQKLFVAMENRIRDELELEVRAFMSYNGENALLIAHPNKRDTVTCYLPAILLNDILYHPGEREWEEFANSFRFELGVTNSKKRYIIPDNFIGNRAEFCRRVWRNLGFAAHWYASQPIEIQEKPKIHLHHHQQNQTHHHEHKKGEFTIFGFIKKAFGRSKRA